MMAAELDRLPVDQLPHGLPLFGMFLRMPAFDAELQVFRVPGWRSAAGLTLHDVLVHPEQFDALDLPAGTFALVQTHGQVWALGTGDRCMMTLRRVGGEGRFDIDPAPGGGPVTLTDERGTVLARYAMDTLRHDDGAVVSLIAAALATLFADEALSAVLVRAYPGLTSLIVEGRTFPRLFASDTVSRDARQRPVWPEAGGDRDPG
ncbi:hypothetical protein [Dactylosporangium sp. NPDC005555]|uniref:hypothetical protein n=1 Tax=Dactylosporangium sp. NPDC005555 TaxID=3154889 RepID=UPI0033ABA0AF